MKQQPAILLCLTLALAAAACGGKGTDLEGVWAIDAWSSNPASCADPGADELANHEPLVFVKMQSFFGQDFVAIDECPDPATCAAAANDDDVELFGAFPPMNEGNDDDGWTGVISFAFGPDQDNNCSGSATRATLTGDPGGTITVRSEEVDVPSFPASGGECDAEEAAELAESLPCTSLEVMQATFMAEL